MDDSFKLRVQKLFGSLQSSHSSSQQQQRPPLWSLSDDEIERREWRRESTVDREDILCSSSFDQFLKEERKYRSGRRKELEDDLDNDDGDGDDRGSSQSRSRKIDDHGDELDIRSYIGMDSTLDNEEEEDEYDIVASGREKAGERLFMSDVSDHGSFLNSHNILQRAFNNTSSKDHRANHMAAEIRLKEDDEEAQKVNDCGMSNSEIRELSDVKASDNGCELRSILKRKNTGTDSKPQKRVRFDCAFKNDLEEQFEKSEDHHSEDSDVSLPAENDRGLPDYLRNPSRYTCYSFDSSNEVGEESNAQTSKDVLKLVPNSKSTESL
ncbi:RNA polymerase-associated protein LEO1-like [Hibiscus syriacus]|uniref:RNA polymerase-associated protein LEO1-like n=1 Tax=Hibiscus syriacus TaxID=106335 RepID=UPI001920CBD9|nr:RNA polymerase-associated protein LEO1-like [Hibiscus syriacus]